MFAWCFHLEDAKSNFARILFSLPNQSESHQNCDAPSQRKTFCDDFQLLLSPQVEASDSHLEQRRFHSFQSSPEPPFAAWCKKGKPWSPGNGPGNFTALLENKVRVPGRFQFKLWWYVNSFLIWVFGIDEALSQWRLLQRINCQDLRCKDSYSGWSCSSGLLYLLSTLF